MEAGVVRHLDRYRWSSYPAYIGRATRSQRLICAYTQKSLATRHVAKAYEANFAKGIDEEIQEL